MVITAGTRHFLHGFQLIRAQLRVVVDLRLIRGTDCATGWLGRWPTPEPSGGAISPADQAQIDDYSKLSADQLKSMQEMARASGDNHEADLIGKALQSKGVPP